MKKLAFVVAAVMALCVPAVAGEHKVSEHGSTEMGVCENFGPQTPRDIDSKSGENNILFSLAPPASEMNLCNIHFHENAEHKAADFSTYAGDGHDGYGSGYKCNLSEHLSAAELAWEGDGVCSSKHGDLVPGDTIEVHWVHTTCDVEPGPTLGACLSKSCSNPQLRVETQVFTLIAEGGLDFNDLQSFMALPTDTGTPVEFLGSTTGPKYSEQECSPFQISWSVRPKCAKLNIRSVGKWCEGNVFNEDHAHGVRALVKNPRLLSEIK
jgi:hypothetical protein